MNIIRLIIIMVALSFSFSCNQSGFGSAGKKSGDGSGGGASTNDGFGGADGSSTGNNGNGSDGSGAGNKSDGANGSGTSGNNDGVNGSGTENNPAGGSGVGGDSQVGTNGAGGGIAWEKFFVEKHSGMIDMVWVIDNSSSMTNEAAMVESNFKAFSDSIVAISDLKLALISSVDENGFDLKKAAPGLKNGTQINYYVDSENELVLLAGAICPASTSSGGGSIKVCGQQVGEGDTDPNEFPGIIGKLNGFFRPNAAKVFVIVTDDNALVVNDSNFLTLIGPHISPQPLMFAFRGTEASALSNCDISQTGVAYENLATKTGGKVFDICEPDWKKHFSDLTTNIKDIVKSRYTLKGNPAKIKRIEIDGQVLPSNGYTIEGQVLVIKPEHMKANHKELIIYYN